LLTVLGWEFDLEIELLVVKPRAQTLTPNWLKNITKSPKSQPKGMHLKKGVLGFTAALKKILGLP